MIIPSSLLNDQVFGVLSVRLLIVYSIFTNFSYYQKTHASNFHGSSQTAQLLLTVFALTSMIFGLGFLIYLGFITKWWAPFVLGGVGMLTFPLFVMIERWVSPYILSFLGFIVLPVCAILLIEFLP
jgi:hypothetical protein